MAFAIGQRWISDTEQDLGLGTVVEIDGRTVSVLFSACDELRVYAQQNAPLTRVIFKVGDTVESNEGWSLLVDDVKVSEHTLIYVGRVVLDGETGSQPIELREIHLSHSIRFNQPQDKLFAGQLDRLDNFVLRYQALHHQYQQLKSPLRGLCGMRAGLIPHQLYIAHEVGRRHAPRVLLADEVGLGKTIEAGMIIHQQLLLGRSSRVLIIVPDSLQHQWLVEMLRRFNLHFSVFDEDRCVEVESEGNPFETQQLVLCSLDFFCSQPERHKQALACEWDLLVVDEAHHLAWTPDSASLEYQIIESFAKQIMGVLLLTATPEQLGRESHFARLRLLDADRFYDYSVFVEEEKRYASIAELVARLKQSAPKQDDTAPNNKTDLDDFSTVTAFLDPEMKTLLNAWEQDQLNTEEIEHFIVQLIDRYGTGRILFRNTRAAIQGFPERKLHLVGLNAPVSYPKNSLTPEIYWLEATEWWKVDPRVDWLLEKLKQERNQKLLVIASNASTALELEQALREREGVRATVFHEGMSIVERDKAAAYFAEQEAGAQVLICSEIGSEGRNFQFAHQLIMFDLPRHPDLLEQRIGRLDRIGQTQTIQIFALYFEQTASDMLAHWYHKGVNAFESTCPAGGAVFAQYQESLQVLLESPDETQLAGLIQQTHRTYQELNLALEQGRDRLLEMQSNGGERAVELADRIAEQDNDSELVEFSSALFDTIGLNQEEKGQDTWVVTPSDQMMIPSYPGLPYEGATITFDRHQALALEDLHFMSWEHPMIQGGIDVLLSEGVGMANVSLLPHSKLPVGTLFAEFVYVVDAQAPRKSGIHQFLPNTPFRLLLDQKGNNLSESVTFEAFNAQLKPIDKNMGRKVVQSAQTVIETLIENSKHLVEQSVDIIKQQAHQQMMQVLDGERERLIALRRSNPNIRTQEIDLLSDQIETLSHHINGAQYRLDALQIIVVASPKQGAGK